jgi:hypothetical protein
MKCRHCLVQFHDEWTRSLTDVDADGYFCMWHTKCPACSRLNVAYSRETAKFSYLGGTTFVYPRAMSREPVNSAVPAGFSGDYVEACNVSDISPKASAALSRRCLQHILRECANVKHGTLDREIQQVLDSKAIPSHIAESLDAVRTTGNFAAHPIKSTSSGEVVDVEPGEAEWNLNTVEQLFDFYFVGPAKTAAMRDALNKKLTDAGKPPLK